MSTGLDSTFKLKGFCLILFQFSTRDAIERYDYCADPEPALVFALAHQVVITTITTPIIIIIIISIMIIIVIIIVIIIIYYDERMACQ